MDCTVTPLKTLMGFSVHLNVQLKFYNLPYGKMVIICQFENFLCIFANICYTIIRWLNADLAQLAEHVISNDEVGGSNPLVSINKTYKVYQSLIYQRFAKVYQGLFLFI